MVMKSNEVNTTHYVCIWENSTTGNIIVHQDRYGTYENKLPIIFTGTYQECFNKFRTKTNQHA